MDISTGEREGWSSDQSRIQPNSPTVIEPGITRGPHKPDTVPSVCGGMAHIAAVDSVHKSASFDPSSTIAVHRAGSQQAGRIPVGVELCQHDSLTISHGVEPVERPDQTIVDDHSGSN